nr:MAG TPA_asm: hypothetical protein [Bacteriophage sp.]
MLRSSCIKYSAAFLRSSLILELNSICSAAVISCLSFLLYSSISFFCSFANLLSSIYADICSLLYSNAIFLSVSFARSRPSFCHFSVNSCLYVLFWSLDSSLHLIGRV